MRKFKFILIFFFLFFAISIFANDQDDTYRLQLKTGTRDSLIHIKVVDSDAQNESVTRKPFSGFIISSDGYALTTYHGFDEVRSIKLQQAISNFDSKPLGFDVLDFSDDIALIKLKTSIPFTSLLTLGDSNSVMEESTVYLHGFSYEDSQSNMMEGRVNINNEAQKKIRVAMSMADGFSGSPVFNSKGLVIGIARKRIDDSPYGFIIPINCAKNLIEKYNKRHSNAIILQSNILDYSKVMLPLKITVDYSISDINNNLSNTISRDIERSYNRNFKAISGYRITSARFLNFKEKSSSSIKINISEISKDINLSFKLKTSSVENNITSLLIGSLQTEQVLDKN